MNFGAGARCVSTARWIKSFQDHCWGDHVGSGLELWNHVVNEGACIQDVEGVGSDEKFAKVSGSVGSFDSIDGRLLRDILTKRHMARGAIVVVDFNNVLESARENAEDWNGSEVGQENILHAYHFFVDVGANRLD